MNVEPMKPAPPVTRMRMVRHCAALPAVSAPPGPSGASGTTRRSVAGPWRPTRKVTGISSTPRLRLAGIRLPDPRWRYRATGTRRGRPCPWARAPGCGRRSTERRTARPHGHGGATNSGSERHGVKGSGNDELGSIRSAAGASPIRPEFVGSPQPVDEPAGLPGWAGESPPPAAASRLPAASRGPADPAATAAGRRAGMVAVEPAADPPDDQLPGRRSAGSGPRCRRPPATGRCPRTCRRPSAGRCPPAARRRAAPGRWTGGPGDEPPRAAPTGLCW